MNILLIDTASDLEIAVARGSRGGTALAPAAASSHAVTLFDTIRRCLEGAGISTRDIELLGVGTGPGSFTGIRIAVATARMLAQLLKIPLVGIPSQELYASSLPASPGEQIMVAFDAKKGRVFGAAYRQAPSGGGIETLAPPGDYTVGALLSRMDASHPAISTGNGIARYRGEIDEHLAQHRFFGEIQPDPHRLGRLLEERYRENPGHYDNFYNTLPSYSRKSDAEIMREQRSGGESGG
ncbi:MAG: tRNA (adenosine(37)-N6)-threonylcarbamoyltransferase complex dimerization subunit type 1 TsaB [Spirochaetes bacterium]|nr:tRNA (adenosine(37)-N6)-threonylcarbamoyltransferase complex dimerization subunit type 1 TsaB [Spirochaetota bacterium]